MRSSNEENPPVAFFMTKPLSSTGAIFAKDEGFVNAATEVLKDSAGNFYVNNPSTGSIVGQQPFGGLRLSGTNDKSGGPYYILKFASLQSIKKAEAPLATWKQAHMAWTDAAAEEHQKRTSVRRSRQQSHL